MLAKAPPKARVIWKEDHIEELLIFLTAAKNAGKKAENGLKKETFQEASESINKLMDTGAVLTTKETVSSKYQAVRDKSYYASC